MPPPPESPPRRRLRRFALLAIVTNVAIVFTGGLVRVTGSGLGCPTWPRCDEDSFVPRPGGAHAGWQTAIEFGNRLLTFVVLASVVAVWLQVRRTRPHPRDVEALAWVLPAGVLGQAGMGGITVLTGLSPWTVAVHFLLSMVLIAAAVTLHERVRPAAGGAPRPGRGLRQLTTLLAVVGFVVLVLGTIVTGAGPHAGDPSTPRLGVDIRTVARVHAIAAWTLLVVTIALVVAAARRRADGRRHGPDRLRRALTALLVIVLAQGAVGYLQYALGIPASLVSIHILGAALMWTAVAAVWVRARPLHARPAVTGQEPPAEEASPATGT